VSDIGAARIRGPSAVDRSAIVDHRVGGNARGTTEGKGHRARETGGNREGLTLAVEAFHNGRHEILAFS
jgi:hypothetical protein